MSDGMHVVSFRNGDHICLFYRDLNEQMAVASPFVKVGLLTGERCLCILTKPQTELLFSALKSSGINPDAEVSRGGLMLASPEETYLAGGKFDREAMVGFLDEGVQEALKLGFCGFRATGDLSCAARDTRAFGQMPEYERTLDKYFPGTKSLGICMYDMRLFNVAQMDCLMTAHRLAIMHPDAEKRAIRIRRGGMFGDVIFDRLQPSSVFHFVIQRDNSENVLMSGQEASLTSAMNAVETAIESWLDT